MLNLKRMTNPFESHPGVGFIISSAHIIASYIIFHVHLPPIIMECAQLGAWVMAILAGGFTCYGVWKTHHKNKHKKN